MKQSTVRISCPGCKMSFDFLLPFKMPRSNPQNKYFHGLVVPMISEKTGYTLDETKDLLKSMFLKDEMYVKTKDGVREYSVVKGSSKLKTDEFEDFMESCRRWASMELGISVPEPGETG